MTPDGLIQCCTDSSSVRGVVTVLPATGDWGGAVLSLGQGHNSILILGRLLRWWKVQRPGRARGTISDQMVTVSGRGGGGHRLCPEGHRLWPEKHRLWPERHRLWPKGYCLMQEGHRLWSNGHRLCLIGEASFLIGGALSLARRA